MRRAALANCVLRDALGFPPKAPQDEDGSFLAFSTRLMLRRPERAVSKHALRLSKTGA